MSVELLDHTGDTGFVVEAESAPKLFDEAARALTGIYLDLESGNRVEPREERAIELEAEDLGALLVDFLNELIYRFDSEGFLAAKVAVEELDLDRTPVRLRARVLGECFDPDRHRFQTEVKAATFHHLEVGEQNGRWRARVILDL